ncbi:MAG: biotin--[acetyl-CoA-carboxylase] ligase [Planctomycetes bacterium]|nr:biotin--[acetyl-CoA-carboxylase] ligase [Planctomycetota bacterium]
MEFHVQRHGTIPSTSDVAFEALRAETARHGDVHVASAQTAGRGRLGRAWHSAPGEGLYSSVVLLPERVLSPAGLTIAAGLAVRDAVLQLGLAQARLKWPNDLVVPAAHGAAKLAGILVETRGLDAARPHYVVGIGVNVAQQDFPRELLAERPVASLATCGVKVDVEAVLAAVLAALRLRLAQIESDELALTRDYLDATGLMSGDVRVVTGSAEIVGRIREFDLKRGVTLETRAHGAQTALLEVVREISALHHVH